MDTSTFLTTVAQKVPFGDLCKLCDKISGKQDRGDKRNLLEKFIAYWREFHDKLHAANGVQAAADDSFFPAMRLLLPHLDRDRPAYGIKEATLAKLYIDVLALGKDSPDAQKLLRYRTPHVAKAEAGDFASVAYLVLRNRCPTKGTLTVADVNQLLDEVSDAHAHGGAEGSRRTRDALCTLLRRTSAAEQKWLVRMILKEMKMGMSEGSILSCYHPDAQDVFDNSSSLSKVCRELKDPKIRQHVVQVTLFNAVRPMLAERAEPRSVERLLNHEPFFAETKFDGERLQVHKDGSEFRYFTRRSHDYSSDFGANADEGSLTQYIAKSFQSHVKSCILDGEVIGYDPRNDRLVSKASHVDVKSLTESSSLQPCFVAFDILLLNGQVVTNKPLQERVKLLDQAVVEVPGRILISKRQNGSTRDDAVRFLNQSIEDQEEGIVLKRLSSVYKPNARKAGWLKLKPEYVDNLVSDLDMLILGGYFGEGRRSGIVSHFLLGVASGDCDDNGLPRSFWSVAKVGSGYSLKELDDLLAKLTSKWKVYDPKRPPEKLVLAQGLKEKPDLYLEPSDSVVLQIKASELVRSSQFRTGITLRFPRVAAIRHDKPWQDVLSYSELCELEKAAGGKLATATVGYDDDDGGSPAKKRRIGASVKASLGTHFQPANLSDAVKKRSTLQGKELCILTGCGDVTKQMLEVQVAELAGTIVQNPSKETFCVVAEKLNFRARSFIKSRKWDVVKADKFLALLSSPELRPWEPADLWCSCTETENRLKSLFDEYGDSYTAPVTASSLQELFATIPKEAWSHVDDLSGFIFKFEQENFVSRPEWGLFRNCTLRLSEDSELNRLIIRLHGGKVLNTPGDGEADNAVFDSYSMDTSDEVLEVDSEWIDECIRAGELPLFS
ncbi:DNA ligase 4 [Dermacentor albipictus]|uniref:DNA ligase 4 n=1 Tax=Dermacentor albipictus TaxID=60249 RepID=UPI0031FBE8FE